MMFIGSGRDLMQLLLMSFGEVFSLCWEKPSGAASQSQVSRIRAAWGSGTQDPPRVPGVPDLCVPVPGVPDLCGLGARGPKIHLVPQVSRICASQSQLPGLVRPSPSCSRISAAWGSGTQELLPPEADAEENLYMYIYNIYIYIS